MSEPTLRIVRPPAPLSPCPDCGYTGLVNPDMVSIACDIKGVDIATMDGLSYAELSEALGYPPCWFHQEGKRSEPSPWEMVECSACNGIGYVNPPSSTPPDSTITRGMNDE